MSSAQQPPAMPRSVQRLLLICAFLAGAQGLSAQTNPARSPD